MSLSERKEELARRRKSLSLFRRPISTLSAFVGYLVSVGEAAVGWAGENGATVRVALACLALLTAVDWLPTVAQMTGLSMDGFGPLLSLIDPVNEVAWFAAYWMGLGILSSVGLGTGAHTGILFLFPHILKVVLAAEACGHLRFPAHFDVWIGSHGRNPWACDATDFFALDLLPATATATLWTIAAKVAPAAFFWGAGTAIGEIPPYFVARAASLAGAQNAELDELMTSQSAIPGVDAMRDWMIKFLENNGFWGVLLMAAWPNAMFDLCGLLCGAFLMPFWTFFGATFIGKAIFKVAGQVLFFVVMFTDEHLERAIAMLEWLIPDAYEPCLAAGARAECHVLLHEAMIHTRQQFRSGNVGATSDVSLVKQGWQMFVTLLIGYFVVSCVEQLAQQHQATVDEALIESWEAEAEAEAEAEVKPRRSPAKRASATKASPKKETKATTTTTTTPKKASRTSRSPARGRTPTTAAARTTLSPVRGVSPVASRTRRSSTGRSKE
jgi:membrane protein YqaA with SNARE-associated domain